MSIKFSESKISMLSNLIFVDNTILSCLFLSLIIELYFLISVAIAEILILLQNLEY